ncbi:MAG: hypothetical protein ACI9EW_004213, partial [Cellvibrionaceae bacterium]
MQDSQKNFQSCLCRFSKSIFPDSVLEIGFK